MSGLERLGLSLLHKLDPEQAHGIALKFLKAGLAGGTGPVTSSRLATSVAGLDLPNPVGVAAGFDKNAEAVAATLRTGFGFCEIGAVTPRPQPGNPKPRLFRLTEDRAAINRFGFNNEGAEEVSARLAAARPKGVIGINLGANKDSEDKSADYATVLRSFHAHVDFATINVSSPNTEKLRDLQGRAALDTLLGQVLRVRDDLGPMPVFLKIAPDLEPQEIDDIAEVCLAREISGIIASNTTISRESVRSVHGSEMGGLSGAPLFERSTEVLRTLYRKTAGRIPLIGVGGVSTAEQAYEKIRAGASAVQLYTAMVYEGISLGGRIARGLDEMLARDGLANVEEAVGADT